MRRTFLTIVVIAVAATQVAAVEVRLRDGTVLEAASYTLTGSYLMLTLADGRQVAYDVADVDLDALRAESPETEPAAAEGPPRPTLSDDGRRQLAMPSEAASGGLAITDQDVEHVRGSGTGAAEDEEEAGAAGGTPEGYQTGGRVIIDNLRVTEQGEDRWLVEGEVINRHSQPVVNVRVQLQTIAAPGERPWSGEVAVARQLPPDEKGVFSHSFSAPKPPDKVHPDVRASVIWMEHETAPERPPAASAAPSVPGAQPVVWD